MNEDELTAKPQYVRKGKTFIGTGNDDIQIGEVEVRNKVTYELPLNGRYDIPEGIHDESSIVKQTKLTVHEGVTVYPTSEDQIVKCSGMYMAEEITIAPLTGLIPENIKKDVVIIVGDKTIVGEYEGFD